MKTFRQKSELSKDVLSIANFLYLNGGKGYLIIGYDKKKNIIEGINPKKYAEEKIQQILNSHSDPPPKIILHYSSLKEGTLVVIEINKSYNGPHQLDNKGFPIRRGSSTAYMQTNEVQYAMQKRDTYSKNIESEYALLSGNKRIKTMIEDTSDVLKGLSFSNQIFCDYQGGYGTRHYYQPCKFIASKYALNNKEYNINFSFHDSGVEKYMHRIYFSTEGFLEEFNPVKPIFIYLFTSRAGSGFFSKNLASHRTLTKTPLKSNIMYFGLGSGFKKTRIVNYALYLPKFYISNVKSKNDITSKLETVLNWINQHQNLFDEIFAYYKTVRERADNT